MFQTICTVVATVIIVVTVLLYSIDRVRGWHPSHPSPGILFYGLTASVVVFFLPSLFDIISSFLTRIYSLSPAMTPGVQAPTSAPATPPTQESAPATPPTQESAPATHPPQESAPSIALPKIENADSIWIILGIVVVSTALIAVIYFAVTRVLAHRKALAEESARRAEATEWWERFVAEKRELLQRIVFFETDWDTLFSLPALADATVPETAKMFESVRALSEISEKMPRGVKSTDSIPSLAFPAAVRALRDAIEVAEKTARKIGMSSIPKAERRLISEIQTALALAQNDGASETERALAYRRVNSLISQLTSVTIPDRALLELESEARKAIEAGSVAAI